MPAARLGTTTYTRYHALTRSRAAVLDGPLLDMGYGSLLDLDFVGPALKIVRLEVPHLHARDEEWCLGEEVLHLLEWASGRLGKHCPEEDRVGKVTNLDKVSHEHFSPRSYNLR